LEKTFRLADMPKFPDGLVWIASYPKSGNTWMRVLLSNLMAGREAPEDINDLSLRQPIAASRSIFEEQTLLDSHLLFPEEIERLRPAALESFAASKQAAAFVKVHDAWTHMAPDSSGRSLPLLGRFARAALYLVRDPRDVAVSFSFHLGETLDSTIDCMNCPNNCLVPSDTQVRQRLSDWSGHIRSWLDQTELPVHLIRYEDLRADTAGTLHRAVDFLGVRFESEASGPETINRAVRHADFTELQRQERQKGFREWGRSLPAAGRKEHFFRQGRAGEWRRCLSAAQVLRLEAAHGAAMAKLGYELVTEQETAA
jgi:hypothetical protein